MITLRKFMLKKEYMLTPTNHNSTSNQGVSLKQALIVAGNGSETTGLLAALSGGWQILETAKYLAHGLNAEGQGYLLTLYNPLQGLTRELNVAKSPDMDALLAFENLPTHKM